MDLRKKRVRLLIRQGLIYSLLLAFSTAATVGYGDVIPHTPASRLFSVVVVLLGLAVLSLVTASLSAIFVEKEVEAEERAIEKELLSELRVLREELHSLRQEVSDLRACAQAARLTDR